MKELYRLLRFARPYTPALLASVFLMAIVGASQGLLIKIIPVIFDRVLQPHTSDAPVVLFYFAPLDKRLLLSSIVPPGVHNIWTMVACGILLCFIAKGICDYLGNYLINLVGLSAIMDLRQAVFDHVLRQDSQLLREPDHRPDHVVHHERRGEDSGSRLDHAGRLAAPVFYI